MRIRTHAYFSFGLSMLFLTHFHDPFEAQVLQLLRIHSFPYDIILTNLIICGSFAWLINQFIDVAGHRVTGPIIRRSWRTHHVLMAPFWGAMIPLACIAVPSWLLGYAFPAERNIVYWMMAMGALIGSEHLLLDFFTPDGIYFGKNLNYHMIGVNGANPILNYTLIGLGLFFAAVAIIHP